MPVIATSSVTIFMIIRFQYLFGVREPNFSGAIDIATKKAVLFIPKLPEEYSIWCGKIQPLSFYKEHYAVDDVHFLDDLSEYLKSQMAKQSGNGATSTSSARITSP